MQSGAKINISDSSCPERIVTVTGTTDQIFKAFSMICKKFEDVRKSLIQQTLYPATATVSFSPVFMLIYVLTPALQPASPTLIGNKKIPKLVGKS